MLRDFQDVAQKIKGLKQKKRVALVSAADDHALGAILKAYKDGLVDPILIGNKQEIEAMVRDFGCNDKLEIIHSASIDESVKIFVDLAQRGQCDAIMKGKIDTKVLMKAIVDKENGFNTGNIISSVAFTSIPSYHKVLSFTDSGILVKPDFDQKKGMLKNALDVLRKLGYVNPKVAVLCAVEKVNPKMQETVDAQELTNLAAAGEFGDCTVLGPLSYDLVVSKEAAQIKGITSEVAGDADLVLVPDLNTGNAVTKALSYSAGATGCAVIVGATIPIIFTSRASTLEEKYWSIAFACATN